MSTHVIGVGEWMHTLVSRMANAADGDLFCLPTPMHLHAYNLVKDDQYPDRSFRISLPTQRNDAEYEPAGSKTGRNSARSHSH
jgi:hypothetical protein